MKTALLIIDVQSALFDGAQRPFEADLVVSKINQLSAKARAVGMPVIFIQHERAGSPVEYASPGWQLQAGLEVKPDDLTCRKTTPDSFLRTDLAELLAAHDITRLVICGYATEFCVDTTSRRALALGYPLVLATDAHTTHDKAHATAAQIRAHHNATLSSILSFDTKLEARNSTEIEFA